MGSARRNTVLFVVETKSQAQSRGKNDLWATIALAVVAARNGQTFSKMNEGGWLAWRVTVEFGGGARFRKNVPICIVVLAELDELLSLQAGFKEAGHHFKINTDHKWPRLVITW